MKREFFFDAVDARKVLSEIVNNPDSKDADRINAAKDLLDRAGYKEVDVYEIQATIDLSPDWLNESELEQKINKLKKLEREKLLRDACNDFFSSPMLGELKKDHPVRIIAVSVFKFIYQH